jgi:ligand-binding sensor domain-containing protein
MRRFLLIFSSLLIGATLQAQHNNFSLRNYTAINGLPQSQVNAIVEDANGYLWVATSGGGLARFDGQEFKVYTTLDGLLSNSIVDLKIDKDQNLWVIHWRGISRFNGTTFKKFQAPGQLSNLKTIRKSHIFEDTLFILSAPGVLGKIYKDSIYYWSKEYQRDVLINRVHTLSNGDLCLFLNDGRIILKTIKGEEQIGTVPVENKISSLFNKGELMIVSFYSPIEKLVKSYTLNPSEKKLVASNENFNDRVLLFDAENETFWLSSDAGLITQKVGETEINTVLKDVDARQIFPDREGNVWIATNGNGLYKYYNQDFTRCSSERMRGVMAILKSSDQATWIGTMSKGLWKIHNGKICSYVNDEMYRNMILCLTEGPDGTVWMGTSGGLAKYDKVKDQFQWYSPADGLSGFAVFNISFDEKGNLWVGTGNGLNYFDGKTFKNYKKEQGLITNAINSTYYDTRSKTLYVGNEFGINTISNGIVKELPIKNFENTAILSIHSYRDSLILMGSTGAGFAIYNPKKKTSHFISTHDGLHSDFIYFIAADKDNYIWVGTEKGIGRILLDNKLNIVENLHYDHENGLEGVETNQNAFYLGDENKFFGLVDGVYQFNNVETKDHKSFNIHLTDVSVFYGEDSSRTYAIVYLACSSCLIILFSLPIKIILLFHITRLISAIQNL